MWSMGIRCIFDVARRHVLGLRHYNVLWLNQYNTYVKSHRGPRTLSLSRSSFFLAAIPLVRLYRRAMVFGLVCVCNNVIVLLVICDMWFKAGSQVNSVITRESQTHFGLKKRRFLFILFAHKNLFSKVQMQNANYRIVFVLTSQRSVMDGGWKY